MTHFTLFARPASTPSQEFNPHTLQSLNHCFRSLSEAFIAKCRVRSQSVASSLRKLAQMVNFGHIRQLCTCCRPQRELPSTQARRQAWVRSAELRRRKSTASQSRCFSYLRAGPGLQPHCEVLQADWRPPGDEGKEGCVRVPRPRPLFFFISFPAWEDALLHVSQPMLAVLG